MPKTRPPYPPELRARLVEIGPDGRTPEELGRQFEPSAQTHSQLGRSKPIAMTAAARMA